MPGVAAAAVVAVVSNRNFLKARLVGGPDSVPILATKFSARTRPVR